ncbi:MAG: hypothetical protein PF436_12275 [Prolixibacteraceae bacterium]|jgi:hypothetical protein|nr:hypothetical protein [Prolixibacteraceae bacterium]
MKANEQELRDKEVITQEAREYAENVIATARVPLVTLDNDLRVITVTHFFAQLFR